ncbi:MAG TPA: TonB-dependent receptor [Candidatus Acidoferrum sp.]|nr:TonB-dependent receptor [Candidatus Acidoferrum sp.]
MAKSRYFPSRLTFLLAVLTFASSAFAGIFGTVRGIVHDSQHRPISGAHILLQAALSDWKREALTDDNGEFQIDSVPAGNYTIRISREGFRESTVTLTVSADSAPLRHFPLEVAGLSQSVVVSESAQNVDTTSSSNSVTLSRQTIADTPGATRANSLDLITDYTPGAYIVHDQLHVRGGHQVSWLVDGIPVPNTNIAANVGSQFDPKDMDVVEIQRGGYSADYGDRTYGTFNVIPRSGFERNREIELLATYGSFHSTDSQISIGDHTDRFAYYASVSGNRTDFGLMPPEPDALHDATNGVSAFTSLIFNATPKDQLRLAASARADFFQIPNTTDQQNALIRDTQRERDGFLNFTWVHTFGTGILLNVAPFVHWNHAAYDGTSPIPSLLPDQPPIPTDHNDSRYEGAQLSLGVTRGRHNARFGAYGFAQQDDSFFRVVATDGTGAIASEKDVPTGGQLSLFAEDQFRAADWLTFNAGLRYTHFSGGVVEDKTDPRIGAAVHIPKLGWVLRAFYGRYYQAPPLTTVSGPLLQFAVGQGFEFLPLHGETDEQREFGLTIPIRGWTLDFSNFQTHALNLFDHDVLGNSNIFFPLTIERARIHGWESTVHSPRIAKRFDVYLTYSNQMVEGGGVVTGGLLADPGQLCDGGGFCYLDHDQRNTLSVGFHSALPFHVSASGNFGYGSGFLDGEGPFHLPGHTEFSLSLAKSFGERFSVGFTAQNLNDSRYLLDNSNTFGGTHWNYPRQFTGQLRYRFHF